MPILRGNDPAQVARCAHLLANGELVAFPTETVYGLGARADSDTAVEGIFRAKGRPDDHPLIVHVADADAAACFTSALPEHARRIMRSLWPGPVTVVVTRLDGVASAAAAGLGTVALRCPDHPVALALIRAASELGVPGIAGPSANRFGRVSPTRAEHVADEFGGDLTVLDGGACREGIESAIIDCTRHEPALLRPGTLSRSMLAAALGRPLANADRDSPRVAGSLDTHYAPSALVRVATPATLDAEVSDALRRHAGKLGVYSRSPPAGDPASVVFRPMPDNAKAVAHDLFAVLRQFDDEGVGQVWIEAPPDDPEWEGVRDRLSRAAANR